MAATAATRPLQLRDGPVAAKVLRRYSVGECNAPAVHRRVTVRRSQQRSRIRRMRPDEISKASCEQRSEEVSTRLNPTEDAAPLRAGPSRFSSSSALESSSKEGAKEGSISKPQPREFCPPPVAKVKETSSTISRVFPRPRVSPLQVRARVLSHSKSEGTEDFLVDRLDEQQTPRDCNRSSLMQLAKASHAAPSTDPATSSSAAKEVSVASESTAKVSEVLRILCFGDSNTAGFYNKGKKFEPYGPILAEALRSSGINCRVRVCGLSGFKTEDMLKYLSSSAVQDVTGNIDQGLSRILEEDPQDLVLLMAGTNDLAVERPSAQAVFDSIRDLHRVCHEHGVPTIALAPPGPKPPLHRSERLRLRSILAEWARSSLDVVGFADCEELVPRAVRAGAKRSLWEEDYIHLSAAGSQQLGQRLQQVVTRAVSADGSCRALAAVRSVQLRSSVQGSEKTKDVRKSSSVASTMPRMLRCHTTSSMMSSPGSVDHAFYGAGPFVPGLVRPRSATIR